MTCNESITDFDLSIVIKSTMGEMTKTIDQGLKSLGSGLGVAFAQNEEEKKVGEEMSFFLQRIT